MKAKQLPYDEMLRIEEDCAASRSVRCGIGDHLKDVLLGMGVRWTWFCQLIARKIIDDEVKKGVVKMSVVLNGQEIVFYASIQGPIINLGNRQDFVDLGKADWCDAVDRVEKRGYRPMGK